MELGAALNLEAVTFEEQRHFYTTFVYCGPYRPAVCPQSQTAQHAQAECD